MTSDQARRADPPAPSRRVVDIATRPASVSAMVSGLSGYEVSPMGMPTASLHGEVRVAVLARPDTYAGHPTTVYLREDALLDAVSVFFTDRVFGPHSQELLVADIAGVDDRMIMGLVRSLIVDLGVDPHDEAVVGDLAAVGMTLMAWRNSPVEDWHAVPLSRISDAELMRVSVATTRLVRGVIAERRPPQWWSFAPSVALLDSDTVRGRLVAAPDQLSTETIRSCLRLGLGDPDLMSRSLAPPLEPEGSIGARCAALLRLPTPGSYP